MPTPKCSWCESETTTSCSICSRPFCVDHASQDTELCKECGVSDDLQVTPTIKDDKGVEHDGRSIKPVGPYFISTSGSISGMSDDELERFYNKYSMLVRQCEMSTDRNRVVLSMIGMERDERVREKARYRSGYVPAARAVKSVGVAALAGALKAHGFTADKLKELIEKKRREQKNAIT